jgi:exopolysaccharide biosynthesis protein
MTDDMDRPKRKRKALRRTLKVAGAIVLVAAGIAGWALNRYVIDHVKISDVKAYEAKVAATSTAPNATPVTASIAVTASSIAAAPAAPAAVPAPLPSQPTNIPTTVAVAAVPKGTPGITVKKVVTGTGRDTITYFVADVVVGDATEFRSAFAENKYGDNIIANTSTIAKDNNATFAINGDYYGYRRSGFLIRNGVVYRDVPARQGIAFYRDGTAKLYDEKSTTTDKLLADGVWNTLSFGPGLVDGGQIPAGIDEVEVDTNIGNHPIQGEQPRSGVGMIGPNHFVFVVADGRSSGYSRGVTMPEFAAIFKDVGAQVAYNLDGGGSSTMYFNGAVVNNPLGKGRERGTSDILYFGPTQ